MYLKCPLWISNVIDGVFLIPEFERWNFNFVGFNQEKSSTEYKLGNPIEFYNEKHRINHFTNFCR